MNYLLSALNFAIWHKATSNYGLVYELANYLTAADLLASLQVIPRQNNYTFSNSLQYYCT